MRNLNVNRDDATIYIYTGLLHSNSINLNLKIKYFIASSSPHLIIFSLLSQHRILAANRGHFPSLLSQRFLAACVTNERKRNIPSSLSCASVSEAGRKILFWFFHSVEIRFFIRTEFSDFFCSSMCKVAKFTAHNLFNIN